MSWSFIIVGGDSFNFIDCADAGGNLNYDVLGKIITAKLMGEVYS